jgi:DNA mismatch repair protein MutS2
MAEQRKADLAGLRNKRRELELRSGGVGELKRLLTESRKTLENLVREVREGSLGTEKTKAVKEFLSALAEAVEAEAEKLETGKLALTEEVARVESAQSGALPGGEAEEGSRKEGPGGSGDLPDHAPGRGKRDFAPGDPVWVGAGRKTGTILRQAKKGQWLVETDSIRLTVRDSELAYRGGEKPATPSYHVELAPRGGGESSAAAFELDLRGMRLAEALLAVQRQVDAASLQNLSLFSIIHGTGEGILGRGVHDSLKGNPAVADYHFARPEEGGYGKTIVRLK